MYGLGRQVDKGKKLFTFAKKAFLKNTENLNNRGKMGDRGAVLGDGLRNVLGDKESQAAAMRAAEIKANRQRAAANARKAWKEKRALKAAEEAAVSAERAALKEAAAGKVELGGVPLVTPHEERWCQLVASGMAMIEAYQVAYREEQGKPREGVKNVSSHVSHVRRLPRIEERLQFLRQENARVAKVGREEKLAMVEAVMRGLMEDFTSGQRGKTVSDLQGMLAMHNQMTGEVERPKLEIKLDLSGLVTRSDADVEKRLGITGDAAGTMDI